MYEKTYKDFSVHVSSQYRCLLRVNGPQGKAIPFAFNMDELEEFQRFIDSALGKMYQMQKFSEDAKLEEAGQAQARQTEFNI